MTILALTSIPPRFPDLTDRLQALVALGTNHVVLTLPCQYRWFPNWSGDIPEIPAGVTLLRAEDHGPATKFLTVYRDFPEHDVLLVDDDCGYGPGWLAAFKAVRAAHPNAVIAASCFDVSRLGLPGRGQIVQGFAGIMLRPRWLDPGVCAVERPAEWVDDLWLSAFIAAAGLDIVECQAARAHVAPSDAPAGLQDAEVDGAKRAKLNRDVAHRLSNELGIWRDMSADSG